MEEGIENPNEEYDVLKDAILTAYNRECERDKFVADTAEKIYTSLMIGEVDLEQAHRVMEKVGEQYPLSLEEMATLVCNVYLLVKNANDAGEWARILRRLNPHYEIGKDKDGDLGIKLT